MIEEIENKIKEIVNTIIAKQPENITKSEYEILAAEYGRLKMKIDSEENNKRMAETIASLWKS